MFEFFLCWNMRILSVPIADSANLDTAIQIICNFFSISDK